MVYQFLIGKVMSSLFQVWRGSLNIILTAERLTKGISGDLKLLPLTAVSVPNLPLKAGEDFQSLS